VITYLINRWAIARKFERTPDGWVYRHWPHTAPISVTDEERELIVSKFSHHGWWDLPIILGGLVVLAIALFGVSLLLPEVARATVIRFGSWAGAFTLLAVVMWRLFRAYTFPLRLLSDRKPLGEQKSWYQAWREGRVRASWLQHILGTLFYLALIWIFFPQTWPIAWQLGAWLAFLTLLQLGMFWGAWLKLSAGVKA
jgi:hypothetical protein